MKKSTFVLVAALVLAGAPAFAATLTVTNNSNDPATAGSLPAQIAAAGDDDVIVFDNDYTIASLPAQTITQANLVIDGETNTIIIDQEDGATETGTPFNITADGVRIANLQFVESRAGASIIVQGNNCELDGIVARGPGSRYYTPIIIGGSSAPDPMSGTTITNCDLSSLPSPRGPNPTITTADDSRSSRGIGFQMGMVIQNTTITNCVIGPFGEAGIRTSNWYWTPYGSGGGYVATSKDPVEPNGIPWVDGLTIQDCRFAGNNPWTGWGTGGFDGDITCYGWVANATVSNCVFGSFEPGDLPRETLVAGELNDWETYSDGNPENVLASSMRIVFQMGAHNALVEDCTMPAGFLGLRFSPYEPDVHHLQGRRNIIYNMVYNAGSIAFQWPEQGGYGSSSCGACTGPHDLNFQPKPTITAVTDDEVTGTTTPNAIIDVYVNERVTTWYAGDDPNTVLEPQAEIYVGTTTADGSGTWTLSTNALTEDDLVTNYDGWWCTAQATGDDTQPDTDGNTSVYAAIIISADNLDSDGDGMTDGWETMMGLDPNSATGDDGADGDPDGDGYTNWEEYNAAPTGLGSEPNDANSTPLNPGPNGEPLPAAGALALLVLGGGLALAATRRRK